MHAAVEAGTEDGNVALARRAAGRQGGGRGTILLRNDRDESTAAISWRFGVRLLLALSE